MVAYISKPESKPINALRLRNQNAKDNQAQTAKEALSCSQSNAFLSLLLDCLRISLSLAHVGRMLQVTSGFVLLDPN